MIFSFNGLDLIPFISTSWIIGFSTTEIFKTPLFKTTSIFLKKLVS